MEREAFLAERRRGIFSTDIGPIFRMCRFGRGPLDVALDKLSLSKDRTSDAMDAGNLFEPLVAKLFTQETGIEIAKCPTAWHKQQPWFGAHGDYRAIGEELLVEIKCSGDRRGWGDPWTDQVPQDILLQCQGQMACYGIHEARVALFLWPLRIEQYVVPYSEDLCNLIIERCGEFWQMLQRGEMPEPDWSDPRTPELIPLMYRPDPKVTVALTADDRALADEIQSWGAARREIEVREDLLKARLIARMGKASLGMFPDGTSVRRSNRMTFHKARS